MGNPDIIEAQVEKAVGFALSSVLRNAITLDKGVVNSRKVLIRLSGMAVRRSIDLNGDAVGSTGCEARRHRFVWPTPPLAGWRNPSHPESVIV
jgi:hypothetical protein